jgi:putative FmdB family regulatory protein
MPLYEYACDACGHRFEVIQKFSDAPLDLCPKCGGAVHKLQSAPAFQFKGSGWYITDYARKDQSGGAKDTAKEPAAESKGKNDGGEKSGTSEKGPSAGSPSASTPTASPPPAKD